MHIEEAFENLRRNVLDLDQGSLLLLSRSEKYIHIIEACVGFLKVFGYSVKSPFYYMDHHERIKTIDDLISYFNELVEKYFPEKTNSFFDRDAYRLQMKKFIDCRINMCDCDVKTAIKECAEIMRVTFKSARDFGVNFSPYPAMFHQKKWFGFLNKIIASINENEITNLEEVSESKFKKIVDYLLESGEYKVGYSEDELVV